MGVEIKCRKCGGDLGQCDGVRFLLTNYCPCCSARVLKKQREALHRMTTLQEVSDMIRDHLLDMLELKNGGDVSADELACLAWEYENSNGVVFCSNYEADRFVMRHLDWVNDAFEFVLGSFGDVEHYLKMKAECNDRFLVPAFIYATECYLFEQLGVDREEGDFSKKRIREIMRQIKHTEYDGQW